jgi:protein-L-isoaspartate O-methyltransferase
MAAKPARTTARLRASEDVPLFVEHCEAVLPRLMLDGVGVASKDAGGDSYSLAPYDALFVAKAATCVYKKVPLWPWPVGVLLAALHAATTTFA